MGKKTKQYRECEECGRPIESGNPAVQLCKRCASKYQDRRFRDGAKHRPKDRRKKRKNSEEDFFEDYFLEEEDA